MIDKLENLVFGALGVAALLFTIGVTKDIAPVMVQQFQSSQEAKR